MIRADFPYTEAGGRLTKAGYDALSDLERRIADLEARLDAVAAVAAASGGILVDAQARDEIAAIKAALA